MIGPRRQTAGMGAIPSRLERRARYRVTYALAASRHAEQEIHVIAHAMPATRIFVRAIALLPCPKTLGGSAPALELNPSATDPMPAGSFVTHFGQHTYFDGAKDEDDVLLFVGEGPETSTPAEVKSYGVMLRRRIWPSRRRPAPPDDRP